MALTNEQIMRLRAKYGIGQEKDETVYILKEKKENETLEDRMARVKEVAEAGRQKKIRQYEQPIGPELPEGGLPEKKSIKESVADAALETARAFVQDILGGMAKGVGKTALGMSEVGEKYLLNPLKKLLTGKEPEETGVEELGLRKYVEPTTPGQKGAIAGEQAAEFFIPGKASLRLGSLAGKASKMKGAGLVTTAAVEGVLGTGQAGLQSGVIGGEEIGAGVLSLASPIAIKGISKLWGQGIKSPAKIANLKTTGSADDLVKQIDEIRKDPENYLEKTKAEAPKISLREKWAGIRPDIKARIQGKTQKLKGYFAVAESRNHSDQAPTAYGYGATQVENTAKKLDNILNDKGGKIGKFREKIKTYIVSADDAQSVMNSFDKHLDGLNLEIKKGIISQKKGKVSKTKQAEISLLQELRNNLKTLKQTPTVDSVIENRIAFDNRINFEKRRREVSGIVDPIARDIRKILAEINRKSIGKEESLILKEYTNLRQGYEELNDYVSRRAGSEFLLRLTLSGRGREAQEVLVDVLKYTGDDLMDDAVMAQIATELLGNPAQQNLFRQEITKAGLDVASILTGKPSVGAIGTLMEGTKKLYAGDVKKRFIEASQKK